MNLLEHKILATLENIELYLRTNYKRICKNLDDNSLSEANQNWIHGELAIINEMLVTFFNKE